MPEKKKKAITTATKNRMLAQDRYVELARAGRTVCQWCGASSEDGDVEWDSSSHEGTHHQQQAECTLCGCIWWEISEPTAYEIDDRSPQCAKSTRCMCDLSEDGAIMRARRAEAEAELGEGDKR